MRIDPQLKALRSDRASQRRIQAEMDSAKAAWRKLPSTAKILAQIQGYAGGESLDRLDGLAELLRNADAANGFVAAWTKCMARVLRRNPLGQIPFQQSSSPGFVIMQIVANGPVSLSLLSYAPRPGSGVPSSASFADREQDEIVLAGAAKGWMHGIADLTKDKAKLATSEHDWSAGDCIRTVAQTQSRQIFEVEGHFTLLQLVRHASDPRPTREYALDTGALIHQACADKRTSQAEMALAVLGEMRRRDALPAIADLAKCGPDHLRWEAVRHALALDPIKGVSLLSEIAGAPHDELRIPASRLLAKLADAHPQLFPSPQSFGESRTPCPV
ncbi:hypothetical protein [Altererythrobacter sp.]|uniref:hypothetical protein n=1 Tax=Altererythrobacter sp. TaxID=1872480 RepID=UPI003D100EE2